MNEINEIIKKYDIIVIGKGENAKYYNLKSVKNFILHFNEISDDESKKIVIKLLGEYLDYISENEIDSLKEAKFLFYEYVYPVGLLYRKHSKFTYFLRPTSLFIYLGFINIFIFFIKENINYFVFFNLLGSIVIYIMYKKSLSTRVFRFDW